MRGRAWLLSGLVMLLMAVAVVALVTTGARWLLKPGQGHDPPAPAPSGLLPHALAEELKRHAHASYLHGLTDAVAFWRLTGVVPDAPVLRDALWPRRQVSPTPLTAPEAQAIFQHAAPELGP
jgi:hypothetical protein